MPVSRGSKSVLVVVASPVEAEAVLRAAGGTEVPDPWSPIPMMQGLDLVLSGIGKANASGTAARHADPVRYNAVLSVGIAGALQGVVIGDVVIASTSVFADEGVETPGGFQDCAAMGFPIGDFPGSAVPVSAELSRRLAGALASFSPHSGPVATVSTCSGTDHLANQVRSRTKALAEGMEGAAVGLAAHRLGILFAEVRVVSNTTGDRDRQVWDMKGSLSRLTAVIGQIAQALRE